MTPAPVLQSALYVGSVMHRRLSPRRHRMRYSAFWALIDLDETGVLDRRLRFFSRNCFNLFSFHDTDHGDGKSASLRDYVGRTLSDNGIDCAGGRIALLCMPRILGYVFNPLSVYFCYRADGSLAALLYEVRNTFGQMHSYLLPVTGDERTVHQHCAKEFYVSPFLEMDMTYGFRVVPPGEHVSVVVAADDKHGAVLVASLTGVRRSMSDRALMVIFFSLPLMTVKVILAIHWEAMKIWWKGMRLYPRPPAPGHAVTAAPIIGTRETR
jgi:DUF1365 family protein